MQIVLRGASVAVVVLVLSVPAAAQFASPFHVIPVVAKVAGEAGTDWRSDVAVSNLSATQARVALSFLREAQANQYGFGFETVVILAPGETRIIEDVLGTYFPVEGNTKGVLLMMVDDDTSEPPMLAVTSRTYNAANASATYGQTVPSALMAMVFSGGRSVLPGARWDDRFRSNVGVVNMGMMPLEVEITVYRANGTTAVTTTRTVEAFSLRQWSLAALGVGSLTAGRVEVALANPPADLCSGGLGSFSNVFIAYMSKVDNATGDGEFSTGATDWSEYEAACGGDVPDDFCGTGAAAQLADRARAAIIF